MSKSLSVAQMLAHLEARRKDFKDGKDSKDEEWAEVFWVLSAPCRLNRRQQPRQRLVEAAGHGGVPGAEPAGGVVGGLRLVPLAGRAQEEGVQELYLEIVRPALGGFLAQGRGLVALSCSCPGQGQELEAFAGVGPHDQRLPVMGLRGVELAISQLQIAERKEGPGRDRIELHGPGQRRPRGGEVAVLCQEPALLREDQRARRLGLLHGGEKGALVMKDRGVAQGEQSEG